MATLTGTEYWWSVHSSTNEYIRFADTKAALIVAWNTAILGVLYSKDVHKLVFAAHWGTAAASVVAFLLLVLAFLTALYAVAPQLKQNAKNGLIYWDDVRQFTSSSKYVNAAISADEAETQAQLLDHIFTLAGICQRKYHLIGWSIRLAFLGSLFAGGLLVLQ